METRSEAAEALEELFTDVAFQHYVENILYAKPLPASADINGALQCHLQAPAVCAIINRLAEHQTVIRLICDAWEAIPEALFGSQEERDFFRSTLMKEGLFHRLTTAWMKQQPVDLIIAHCLLNSIVRTLPNHRNIIQAWIAPFAKERISATVEAVIEKEAVTGRTFKYYNGKKRKKEHHSFDRTRKFEKVKTQKQQIQNAMQSHDFERVWRYVDALIEYHLETSDKHLAAKSICDLAMEAKHLGMFLVQLELTEKAIELSPDDGWSWAQHGDALLENGHYSKAIAAYQQAENYGNDIIGQNGRAGVLKAMNRLPEALDAYDIVIAEHSENVVAKNGRAGVLKAMNRLSEALDAYNLIITEHPDNFVAKTGKAEVLKRMNRLPEALYSYDLVITERPTDIVAKTGKACVLAAMSRRDEALELLPTNKPITQSDWIGYHIRGMILLRNDEIEKAISIFEEGIELNPWPGEREYFHTALAVARLRQDDYNLAIGALADIQVPELQVTANLLRVHAFGELRILDDAKAAYNALPKMPSRSYKKLQQELCARYIRCSGSRRSKVWVVEKEVSCLLLTTTIPCDTFKHRSNST